MQFHYYIFYVHLNFLQRRIFTFLLAQCYSPSIECDKLNKNYSLWQFLTICRHIGWSSFHDWISPKLLFRNSEQSVGGGVHEKYIICICLFLLLCFRTTLPGTYDIWLLTRFTFGYLLQVDNFSTPRGYFIILTHYCIGTLVGPEIKTFHCQSNNIYLFIRWIAGYSAGTFCKFNRFSNIIIIIFRIR